jgi:hypothetical protein
VRTFAFVLSRFVTARTKNCAPSVFSSPFSHHIQCFKLACAHYCTVLLSWSVCSHTYCAASKLVSDGWLFVLNTICAQVNHKKCCDEKQKSTQMTIVWCGNIPVPWHDYCTAHIRRAAVPTLLSLEKTQFDSFSNGFTGDLIWSSRELYYSCINKTRTAVSSMIYSKRENGG